MTGKGFSRECEVVTLTDYTCSTNCLSVALYWGKSPPGSTGQVTALDFKYYLGPKAAVLG